MKFLRLVKPILLGSCLWLLLGRLLGCLGLKLLILGLGLKLLVVILEPLVRITLILTVALVVGLIEPLVTHRISKLILFVRFSFERGAILEQ